MMPDIAAQGLGLLTRLLEIVGAGFLVLGFLADTVRWWFRYLRRHRGPAVLEEYRLALARSVLIGLELLIAATIIKTVVVEPSVESMGLLVAMILIRTVLGWTTTLELNGRWPWQSE